jgi:hypothetical protein
MNCDLCVVVRKGNLNGKLRGPWGERFCQADLDQSGHILLNCLRSLQVFQIRAHFLGIPDTLAATQLPCERLRHHPVYRSLYVLLVTIASN